MKPTVGIKPFDATEGVMAADKGKTSDEEKAEIEANVVSNLEGAPTIFIDGMQGLSSINDVVKINLFQIVQELPKDGSQSRLRKVVVGRLAMTPATLVQCLDWLNQAVKIEKVGESDQDKSGAD